MQDELFEQRTNLATISNSIELLQTEIKKVIVGQENMLQLLTAAILANGHVLIEGAPGIGKTLTAKLLAKTVQAQYSRIQFTPDLMPSDVIGTNIFNPGSSNFEFKKGPIFGNIILIDEINRAPAKTQAALFEVMEEKQVTVDGKAYLLQQPFMIVATQNPIEQEGTYRLPEAQLDRFLFKIEVPYPTATEELEILQRFHAFANGNAVDQITAVLSAETIAQVQQTIKNIVAEPSILEFIANIIVQTRNNKAVYLGASPRASLAMLQAAKAIAAIQGRDFVTPDDVKFIAKPVLRHRLVLTPEKEMEGGKADDIIDSIINAIEAPR
jgi:MoxR-like ATPase